MKELKELIRIVPDFPKKGISFKDITTLLKDKDAFHRVIDHLAKRYEGKKIDAVIGVEARGFILAGALAYHLRTGMVPIRKKGKLPAESHTFTYSLEYGTDTVQIHKDALKPRDSVVLIDDLLATGGTVSACVELLKTFPVHIEEIAFLIELTDLKGREQLKGQKVYSMIQFPI